MRLKKLIYENYLNLKSIIWKYLNYRNIYFLKKYSNFENVHVKKYLFLKMFSLKNIQIFLKNSDFRNRKKKQQRKKSYLLLGRSGPFTATVEQTKAAAEMGLP